MNFEIIDSEEEFLQLREKWNSIAASMEDATPFQTWEWNFAWWKNSEDEILLHIIKGYEGTEIYGIAPLVIRNGTTSFIGGEHIDYGLFLIHKKKYEVISGFVDMLRKDADAFVLQQMPSHSPQIHSIKRILSGKNKCLIREMTRTAYISLREYEDFDDYYTLLSKNLRQNTIRPSIKSGITFQHAEINDDILHTILSLYEERQRERINRSGLSWLPGMLKNKDAQPLYSVYIARIEDDDAAFMVTMTYNNRIFLWLTAYAPAHGNIYPGQGLYYHIIRYGFEQKIDVISFMRGDYDFKLRWNCDMDTNYSVYGYPTHISCLKARITFFLRQRLRKLVYSNQTIHRFYQKRAGGK
ncbi:GNAT family N-acetyltransferase [Parasporobacterium paucivorans]|uniref:Acetyltransferase involved in cellulose biosynthesis, CelD/BcsL family n=1 Tax=Parasporobacterium paucivorans DSM 15970 TaxID=1122934 RepID=A0A1M6GUG4_9FIRM|nr:GNAT family N-acetyltransferase [Parasporobacterium paucivorans]SHJ13606.1 Acetyltransferase involved in cellulose biosynthesis, CelD/BcsL family [Parasporobacterium paucivorans DSM 15970]